MTKKVFTSEDVRRVRRTLGMTQSELATALNVSSREMIGNWEVGMKGGKEYLPSGTAVAAMLSLVAILRAVTLLGIHHPATHVLLEPLPHSTRKKIERASEEFEE